MVTSLNSACSYNNACSIRIQNPDRKNRRSDLLPRIQEQISRPSRCLPVTAQSLSIFMFRWRTKALNRTRPAAFLSWEVAVTHRDNSTYSYIAFFFLWIEISISFQHNGPHLLTGPAQPRQERLNHWSNAHPVVVPVSTSVPCPDLIPALLPSPPDFLAHFLSPKPAPPPPRRR